MVARNDRLSAILRRGKANTSPSTVPTTTWAVAGGPNPSAKPASAVPKDKLMTKLGHKLQQPPPGPDMIALARSGTDNSLKRTIGVNSKPTGILKESSLTTPKQRRDDDSLESIGVLEGFPDTGGPLSAGPYGIDKRQVSWDRTTPKGSPDSQNSNDYEKRRVSWEPSVKGGRGCNVRLQMKDLIGDISDMTLKNVSKLDATVQRMAMNVIGGGPLCAPCDTSTFDNNDRCAKCGVNGGLGGGLFADDDEGGGETNDLVEEKGGKEWKINEEIRGERKKIHSPIEEKRGQWAKEDPIDMRETMLETQVAIKEFIGSYEEMRATVKQSRDCVEDSRCVMNDCRDAVIQSKNVAMKAKEEQKQARMLMMKKMMSGKNGKYAKKKGAEGAVVDVDEMIIGKVVNATSPRSQKQVRYHHSTSLRASADNIEAGMGNAIPKVEEDPFSSSMHAFQRSPRNAHTIDTDAYIAPSSAIKKKKQRNHGADDRYLWSPPVAGTTSAAREYRNVKYATKYVNPQNVKTSSQDKSKRKKKNINRLVVGGLKFVGQGVKRTLKTRVQLITAPPPAGPAATGKSTRRRHHS